MLKIKSAAASPFATENCPDTDVGCCSTFYENDWVRKILDDNFHPGGEALTRRSIAAMGLPQNALIADLGCGTGSSAMLIARENSYRVCGIDRSRSNIIRAQQRQQASGIDGVQLRFLHGDATELPFQDGELDAILAECSFSLIDDQHAALHEFHRVLRPHGLIGLSDMAIEGTLPADIEEVIAPWTCLLNAHSGAGYRVLFEDAGFDLLECSDESAGLLTMISGIKRKLLLIGTGMVMGNIQDFDFDLATAKHWLQRMQAEVEDGRIRYLGFQLQRRAD